MPRIPSKPDIYDCRIFDPAQEKRASCLRVIKKHQFYTTDLPVTGAAPKDFIHIYKYGDGRKVSKDKWPAYICKVGHKVYPTESITEMLLNKVGEALGVNMAESEVVRINNQFRFISRFFLNDNERLIHGAEIYSGYLSDDLGFVKAVEEEKMSREWFTFQFTVQAVAAIFPSYYKNIMKDFVRMLLYDAIIGNNDRHMYNWGVISNVKKPMPPRFSPIYDTARGLCWNTDDSKLASWRVSDIEKYCRRSYPKICWEGFPDLNHFGFIQKLYEFGQYEALHRELINVEARNRVINYVRSEFSPLLSRTRLDIVARCLAYRFDRLIEIVK